MKKLFLAILMAVICVMGIEARTFVLVTGISNYGNENNNLGQTTKDAKRFADLMKHETNDITLLTSKNVTKANVLEKLRAICNRAQTGDRVVFFYSGHGMKGALYAYDQPIPYDDVVSIINSSAASEKIAYIDACYAGSVADKAANEASLKDALKAGKNSVYFVSSRPTETSIESPILGAGFFTQALLKGLRGKSDTNGDKKITVIELFKYIYGDVLKRSQQQQHPQLIAPESMHNTVLMKW